MAATLSIVIPCYNEEATLAKCLDRVLAIADANLVLEIIIVDDASRDGSVKIAEGYAARNAGIRVLRHTANSGKGASLQTGFASATGDYVVVQDADLEYNPQDLLRMLPWLVRGEADIVFGSRFTGTAERKLAYGRQRIGNHALTWASNLLTGLRLTDMETCYKMFRRDVIQSITLEEKRFGIEPEMVAKLAKLRSNGKRLRIREEPVGYLGRTYEEGKKIGLRDGFRALYCIAKYSLR